MKDAETQLEHFALELFNWHLANNPKIHDLCLHAQDMATALAATVNQSLTVDHAEQSLGMVEQVFSHKEIALLLTWFNFIGDAFKRSDDEELFQKLEEMLTAPPAKEGE